LQFCLEVHCVDGNGDDVRDVTQSLPLTRNKAARPSNVWAGSQRPG
jgi:hypothetical protein